MEGKGRKQLRGDTGTHAQMLSLSVGARPAHGNDRELQLVIARQCHLKQPTKCWSDFLHKEVQTPVKSSSTVHVPTSLRAPASPSSQGTCICGWTAASGPAAGRWWCPYYQGEHLSCHHRMPPDGSSALASPAGVWKRNERDL